MSPPAVFVGLASSRPVVVTRRPSSASARPAARAVDGAGSAPGPEDADVRPRRPDLELAVRRRELAGHLEHGAARPGPAPVGRWTTRPPVASPIASSDGVPSRPASATTTPRSSTRVPIGSVRARAIDDRLAVGDGVGRRRRGRRRRSASASAVGDGRRRRVAVGVGVGVGGRRRRRRRARRRRRGRPARARRPGSRGRGSRRPVPELSRWPSGPVTVASIPAAGVRPARASGPMTARTGPEPSSTVRPRPSARSSGDPVDRAGHGDAPAFERLADARRSSIARAAGRRSRRPVTTIDASATRSVRCE